MSDDYNKNNLEDLFRNGLDPASDQSGESGWDLPSDAVWYKVDKTLRPGRGRGLIIWWALGAIVLLGIIGILFFPKQEQIAQSPVTIQKENSSFSEESDHLKEKETTSSTSVSNDFIKVESNPSEENRSNNLEVDNPVISSTKEPITVENKNIDKPTSKVANADVGSAQRQPSRNNKNSTIDSNPIKKEEETSGITVDIGKNSITSFPNNIDRNTSGGYLADTTTLRAELKKLAGLPMPFAAVQSLKEKTVELPPIVQLPNQPTVPNVAQAKGIYAGLEAGLLQSYRTVQAKREFIIPRFYEEEEPDLSIGYGFNVGYQFSRNWSVETGLHYSTMQLDFIARRQLRYSMVDEQSTGNGEFQSSYKLPFESSTGTIDSDIAVARSEDISLEENDFIPLSLTGQQNFEYLNIPLLLRYHYGKGKWQVGVKGGVVNRILLDGVFQFTSINTSRPGLRAVVEDHFFRKRPLTRVNEFQVDIEIGIGVRYLASERLWFYVEPTYRRSINPSHESINFKTYPTVKALEAGMAWRF